MRLIVWTATKAVTLHDVAERIRGFGSTLSIPGRVLEFSKHDSQRRATGWRTTTPVMKPLIAGWRATRDLPGVVTSTRISLWRGPFRCLKCTATQVSLADSASLPTRSANVDEALTDGRFG